jgi:hypothetical protein
VQTAETRGIPEPARIPPPVKIFLAFSAAAAGFQLTIFIPALTWVHAATVPFTGWVGGAPYLFALGSWPQLFRGINYVVDVKTLRWYLMGSCVTLLIFAAFGVVDFYEFGNLRDETSPWLRYHPWRPLWTIGIPLMWCALLWAERRRIRGGDVDRSGERPHLADERSARERTKKSTGFFSVFWSALIVWCYEAFEYWVHHHRTSWSPALLVLLAAVGLASLAAGIIFRKSAEYRTSPDGR